MRWSLFSDTFDGNVSGFESVKGFLFYAFPALIVLGNFQLWIGGSSLTLPYALILLLPVFLYEICKGKRSGFSTGLLPFVILYLSLYAAALLSISFSSDVSLLRNIASLLPLSMAIFVILSFKEVIPSRGGVSVFLLSGALLSLLVLGKVFLEIVKNLNGLEGIHYPQKNEIRLPLGMSNYLAVHLTFFSVFAFRYSKPLWLLCFVATLATLSRFGVVFFLLAGLATWSLRFLRPSAVFLGVLTVPLGISLLGFLFSWQAIDAIRFVHLPESVVSRAELWGAAIDAIASEPVWGASVGGFTSWLERMSWPEAVWGTHNLILSVWLDYGLLGLVFYALIIVLFFVHRSKLEREEEEHLKLALLVVLVYGLFENVGSTMSFEILLAYLICFLSQAETSKATLAKASADAT